ncbi:Sodium/calcium exchanger protein-domain-containing protein [Crepidotus variabilis]|uniref:Sodium/calcium exchanger protein-domain-containing protein n=1 Tax=Crepidotus variabilis TaxID=179855 RepID=A0A9P6E9G9_9AGAR|nr:Sodium/calcium exchanger protein-domain-containing protein [Crepidotus variabilis]
MSTAAPRLIFIFLLVINCILWSRSRYSHSFTSTSPSDPWHGVSLVKRMSYELSQPLEAGLSTLAKHECRPRAFPVDDQCRHVVDVCPASTTVLRINYLRRYFCTDVALRPAAFLGLIIWLIFLFSTLGISASDFFTPNLATIAQLLGLDENVAGVTFLAFGNGSPDVFSTFSAMRADSGSLAVGELLGAATFIVSCVVGSMCIIKPFQIYRGPFLRDVGFFSTAVALVLVILWDGRIEGWEAAVLVGLYVIYAFVVVIQSWWQRRRERKRQLEDLIRSEYAEDALFPRYSDEPLPNLTLTEPSPAGRTRAISAPNPPRIQTNLNPRRHSRSPSSSPSHHVAQLPHFSLIGALEFRDVVATLKTEASSTALGIFESPVTPYAGGHYGSMLGRTPRSSLHSSMDEETLQGLRLGRRPLSATSTTILEDSQVTTPLAEPTDYFGQQAVSQTEASIPSIMRTPASPSISGSEIDTGEQLFSPQSKRQRVYSTLRPIFFTLFPTLSNFFEQSKLSQIACIFAAPAVLALTLTLPVVTTPYESSHRSREKLQDSDARLVDFEDEEERVLIAEGEVDENLHQIQFKKWLMAVQCVCGPLFVVKVLFDGVRHEIAYLLGAGSIGFALAVLVLLFSDKGESVAARMTRCSMGFLVAVVWIMAIADEVVNVLQTFGMIFGLSDAIVGLTIFAVGNSLADLVANMSVAAFAPVMGFSACFGGPMLNILLGIGVSGSYIIGQTGEPYDLRISTTLYVSSFGLLFLLAATMIFVPLNDYFLTRRWGILLILSYLVIMIINIVVELKS